jgi:pimeloyl-ACP methyl ester carboxylesterase
MIKERNAWLDTTEYPFYNRYMTVNGQQLHYIDEGQGHTLVFVHGTPSWSFDYRKVILELRGKYRCLAYDHIGFGLSDKPAQYDYSIQNHAETLEKFIALLTLKNITLVLHDFGGPMGFHYALKNPGNIKSIVVMNSWLWDFSEEPVFKSLRKTINSPLTRFLYRYFNFSPKVLLPQSFGKKKLSRKLLKNYTKPFGNSSERYGPLAFARSLVNDQQWFENCWQRRQLLQHIPLLFIWGMMDKFVKPEFLEKFTRGFPQSIYVALESCGHFPQEESPEEVVKAIKLFLENSPGSL